jgi:GNAT superfamily N-acetyltransferase
MIRVNTLRLYERRLDGPITPGTPGGGLEIAVWDSPEAPAWAGSWWRREAAERLREGQACAVARHGGHVVAYCWLAVTPVPVAEIDRVVVPGAEEVYLYDAFTIPEWRGRGLFTTLLLELLTYMRRRGRKRALIFVLARNEASRRAIERGGFRLFQTVSRVELLGLRFVWPRGPWPRSARVTLVGHAHWPRPITGDWLGTRRGPDAAP